MSVIENIIQWLYGFPEIGAAERITPDMLEAGDMSLAALPEDSVIAYMSGDRDVTMYALFRVRQASRTHAERLDAQAFMDALSRWVWARNLAGDLPRLDGGREAQSVRVSQSPYMLETNGGEAVYQIGIELNYIDEGGIP